MRKLFDCQAKAVLAYLDGHDGIEKSWHTESASYQAAPKVARWENGREQGYVVTMRSLDLHRQINIAFFEHRNSDAICAIEWEQVTTNSPTIDTAKFGDVYKDKWDVSHEVRYGEAQKMADWIYERLTSFWTETANG